MWFVCTIISNSHIRDSLVVVGGLAPIWGQDICHHQDDVGCAKRLNTAQQNSGKRFEIVLIINLGNSSVRQYKLIMVG